MNRKSQKAMFATKKEHLRELEKDYDYIFNRVCSGKLNPKDEKQQLELAIKLDQEYRNLRDGILKK